MNSTSLLAWWSFNNTADDADLLNATGLSGDRSNTGHLLDNNDPFDDGFYDPAESISGVTPQSPGIDALLPVADGADGSPGALIRVTDPGPGIPDVDDYGALVDVTGLVGDNFATSTADNWGSFSGTDANRPSGSYGGGSLAITGDDNNGAFFDIRARLADWSDIEISWANRGTGTGFDSRSVSVSNDGGLNFTQIFTDTGTLGSSWTVATADAGALLDGADDAIIRFTLDGATSNSGNNRFDNIQLRGAELTAATIGSLVFNEVLADPNGSTYNFDTDGDGTAETGDEFVELYNTGATDLDVSGYQFWDAGADNWFTVPEGTVLAPGGYLLVVGDTDGGSLPDVPFGSHAFSAGRGGAGTINNGGDNLVVYDSVTDQYIQARFNGDAEDDPTTYDGFSATATRVGATRDLGSDLDGVSLALSPDGNTANPVRHTDIGDGGVQATPGTSNASGTVTPPPAATLVINEVDADTPGADTAEFVELFDGGAGNTALDGYSVVFFNGSGDTSYAAFDLDGYSTDADGYFVLGNSGVANVDLVFADGGLQNGADAVALYQGDAADFADGTSVTTTGLIDAVVYDTDDADDAGLLDGLGRTTQVNENAGGAKDTQSNARVPNGSGDFTAQAPTPGAANDADTPPPPPGDAELTLISTIQGTPATQVTDGFGTPGSSAFEGQSVRIEGVVTAVFSGLGGFFMQEEASDSDGDALSSEGIFVFFGEDVALEEGYRVSVVGAVDEYFGMTQIDNDNGDLALEVLDSGDNLGLIDVPVIERSEYGGNEDVTALEQFEGMKVSFGQDLVVSEYFQLARFGEVTLYEDGRPSQYTQVAEPDVAGYAAYQEDLASRRVLIDDGDNFQNAPLPDGAVYYPQPGGLSTGTQGVDFFRGGDVVSDLTGVLHWSFAGASGTDAWRVRPTEADPIEFTPVNDRTDAPEDVGGGLKVASFNVLNYFTTIDDGTAVTATGQEPRGADSAQELERQTAKIVDALSKIDAQVFGLLEIENDDGQATAALVDALNDRVGSDTYAYIDTGVVGTDAIKVALIYDQTAVRPVGDYAVLDTSVDPRFADQANRPALAQTFEDLQTTGIFTASVNHFKSKGSIFDGDVAAGDGAGNNDQVRTDAAEALVDWLATDPTGSGDSDVLILGDLNSYAMEDPIDAIKEGADDIAGTGDDYVNLLEQATDGNGYSYLFDGQLGTLDYALANTALNAQVTGATAWHINADEVPLFDYNDEVQDPSEASFEAEPSGNDLYEPTAYRASDHDPVIIGLDLDADRLVVADTTGRPAVRLTGTDARELILAGDARIATLTGNGGADTFVFEDAALRQTVRITDYSAEDGDLIDLSGATLLTIQSAGENSILRVGDDGDSIFVFGVDADDINIINAAEPDAFLI